MKNKIFGIVISIILLVSLGFLLKSFTNDKVKLGTYYLEKDDFISVKFMKGEVFEFYTNMEKSYVATGKFKVKDNVINLKTNEGEIYIFQIKEDNIILQNDVDEVLKSGSIFELSYMD